VVVGDAMGRVWYCKNDVRVPRGTVGGPRHLGRPEGDTIARWQAGPGNPRGLPLYSFWANCDCDAAPWNTLPRSGFARPVFVVSAPRRQDSQEFRFRYAPMPR
jgi:hypothetical protein